MPAGTEHFVGGTKRFECRVKGSPRPNIRWFKDGDEITNSGRYSFDHSQDGVISMVIKEITHEDEGHYRWVGYGVLFVRGYYISKLALFSFLCLIGTKKGEMDKYSFE